MNPICREEFDKAKNLIRLRKENIGLSVKPDVQNLDSGILLQFFENWEDTTKNFNGKEIEIKKRIFDVLNHKKIHDATMYFTNDSNVKDFILEYKEPLVNRERKVKELFKNFDDDETENADAGDILISHDTYLLVKDHFRCEEKAPVHMKGFSQPVQTYRVIENIEQNILTAKQDGFYVNIDFNNISDKEKILAFCKENNIDVTGKTNIGQLQGELFDQFVEEKPETLRLQNALKYHCF